MSSSDAAEPNVISEALLQSCIQVQVSSDAQAQEEKRRATELHEVETLIFSFKNLSRVDNLRGLSALTKLQLDNNIISRIEKLGHLTSLTWLDLSFNNIARIEGLETLTRLTDLSLFANLITRLENLDALKRLSALSVGNNAITELESVMYLRRFDLLRLVNLGGNPFCRDPEYQAYVIAHLKHLRYLDYRLVQPDRVLAAREQYQDELIEVEEVESKAEETARQTEDRRRQETLFAEANMLGIDTLVDDMLVEDMEHTKLKRLPGLTDGLAELCEKTAALVDEFQAAVLEQHERKRAEVGEFREMLERFMGQQDAVAKEVVVAYERLKKRTLRELRSDPGMAESLLKAPRAENEAMLDSLMDLEMRTVEVIAKRSGEFDSYYAEIIDKNKQNYTAFFTSMRELENAYFEGASAAALALLEQYANGEVSVEGNEVGQALLADKDALMNSVQGSHDAHTSRLDALEDRLVSQEVKAFDKLVADNKSWEYKRNRDRVSEIWSLVDRNRAELNDLLVEV
jgi:hypothetical protein